MTALYGKPSADLRITYLAALFGSTPAVLMHAVVFSKMEFMRYSYPYIVLIYLSSFALLLGEPEGRAWLDGAVRGGSRVVVGLLIVVAIAGWLYSAWRSPTTAQGVISAIEGDAWNPDADRPLYRQLQASIPAGERFLAFVPMAHLLDFARNPINVMDSDCAISPPPGMPLRHEPEQVAQYLRALGITRIVGREICWTPGGESQDPEKLRRWSESFKGTRPWDHSLVYSHYLMFRAVKSLAAKYETMRFAADLLVIDLDRPRAAPTTLTRSSDDSRQERRINRAE
jgi:hypothetical protein